MYRYDPSNERAQDYILDFVKKNAPRANYYLRALEAEGLEEFASGRAYTFIRSEQEGKSKNRFATGSVNRTMENIVREAEEINLFLSRNTHTVKGAKLAVQRRKESFEALRRYQGINLPTDDKSVKNMFNALGNSMSKFSRGLKYEIMESVGDLEDIDYEEIQLQIDRYASGEINYAKLGRNLSLLRHGNRTIKLRKKL